MRYSSASGLRGYYAHSLRGYPARAAPLSPPQAPTIRTAASPDEHEAQARLLQTPTLEGKRPSFAIYDGHPEEASDARVPSSVVAIWETERSG